ncbi:DUF167 domain-containing protein [Micromonospora zingiberis]|uniref:UPF0235 protein E0H26_10175 n=1 Tax=Micromonospora zingiberis TaxID=2053011 RepID=A0A4V2LWV1_9ACTN|nr:DUF167 domain-containing protein [Micromonospora zingiberis]TCB97955.1 DUF167 domain-containing protein [Micromonospora zingiberis]
MADALTVAVRVKPGASRARVGGRYDGPHGPALVIAVNAPPVDGRATEAARRALAAALGVRPAAVSLRTGAASRDKIFVIASPTADLADHLHRLLTAATPPADRAS